MKKIMLLTDSYALPRGFPEDAKTLYEQTYPMLLKKQYPQSDFFQLSIGSISSVDLIGQALSYFEHWQPDYIILHAGMLDCRPEPISPLLKFILSYYDSLARLRAYIYKPKIMNWLVRWKPSYNISPGKFKRNIKKLKLAFPNSKILWLEIATTESGAYDKHRPGVIQRMREYNNIIHSVLGPGFIETQKRLWEKNGIHTDNLHLNKNGHLEIYNILNEIISKDSE